MSHSTILVTGALGFLGKYVCQEFHEQGWRVAGVAHSSDTPSFIATLYPMALPSPELDRALTAEKPDVLVHLAGTASVGKSQEHPYADFHNNVTVFAQTLDAVRRIVPHCRILFISSASVYGDAAQLPMSETAPFNPVSPYGYHKMMCEQLAAQYAHLYNIQTHILRVFSAYGEPLQRQVLWDIAQKAIRTGSVSLFGTGDETRDFLHAQDVAHAIACIAQTTDAPHTTWNVASGQAVTVRHLAQMMLNAINPDVPLSFNGETRSGDPLHLEADIQRLKSIGYAPQIPLEDGVAAYAHWAKASLTGGQS
jgi:UDP-glucose 4-epimerase